MRKISSAIISIGNEILLGKTLNSNLAYLATGLANLGAPVVFNMTVMDIEEDITAALDYCMARYDIVISTGGLGSTADDITKATIARFFGKELMFHEDIWSHIQALFSRRGFKAPEINRNQALVPQDFIALQNNAGTAPGLFYRHGEKCFFSCAGVPMEMSHVFDTHIRHIVKEQYPWLQELVQHTIHTFGISESALAERLDTDILPPDMGFAWLPQTGRVDLRLYGHHRQQVMDSSLLIQEQIPEYTWGLDGDTPPSVLGRILREKNLSIGLAESCTGGLVMKMLSDEAGASDYLLGGVVSYHNSLKQNLLKVSGRTLETHGAVSEETALEMVRGIKSLTGSDCAISVTGIAGPSGGSDAKPVGTVWFGFCCGSECWAVHTILSGTRESIRYKAAEMAIIIMIKKLLGKA